jgi:hypothetical protein
MDEVHFARRATDENGEVVEIEVNGRPLAEVVGEVERPFAEAEGHPSIAGSYLGLVRWQLAGTPSEHFMGTPDSHLHCGPKHKTVLLGCVCGEPGCWPLMARIEVEPTTVAWGDFEQPHRADRWSHGELRFEFERRSYESALAALADGAGSPSG